MRALIMAGGRGTRLRPYSATLPKPLMPIGDRPILEILLNRLSAAGVDHSILAVSHMRHLIEAFFGQGERFGLKVSYSFEDQPLGTAGPIGQAIDRLGDTFVVTNGDLLTTLDVKRMIAEHRETGADVTVGSYRRELKSDFGILDVDGEMRMTAYREKPTYTHLVSMGIYVMEAAAVRPFVAPETSLDMPDLLRAMIAQGKRVHCFQDDCFWLDIGRPDDFARAQQIFEDDPDFFLKS
ncbi:MAG: NTP transferase domain-containing protein [Rhodospirillaceae bacterium]|nr:NTP transferase domain-containing protein [Rhodospirillaceae bacterium]